MSQLGYVYLGWGVCFGTLLAYSIWIVLRGRRIARHLPPGERTWR